MNQSLKIVFFGNEHLATGVQSEPLLFKALLASQHSVVALVVHSSAQTSRSAQKEHIVELAEQHDIPVLNPEKTADCIDTLRTLNADCGVLAAYGKMVPQEVIDIFPHGIINLHPSLLPKLRGSTPIESVILNGLTETGVSIMKLVRQMDAGPILTQELIQLEPYIPKQVLADRLHALGAKNLLHVLDHLELAESAARPQQESDASFCSLIAKQDGLIDWGEPAAVIERKIRAYSGWPKSYFMLNGARYVVHTATVAAGRIANTPGVIDTDNTAFNVQTSDGILSITTIQPEGKKEMPIQAFLAGYRERL